MTTPARLREEAKKKAARAAAIADQAVVLDRAADDLERGKLQRQLGHQSATVSERYARLALGAKPKPRPKARKAR
jgi:hypothetical protein